MSNYKKHEIPIPEELLSKYRIKAVTYRVFNYLKNGIENREIEIIADPKIVKEEIKKPQLLEIWKGSELDYSEMEEIFNSASDGFKKVFKGLKMKTPEANRIMMNLKFYIERAQSYGELLLEELFDNARGG